MKMPALASALVLLLLPLVSAQGAVPRWRALARKGLAEARQERLSSASRWLRKALSETPDDASRGRVLVALGRVFRRAGDSRRVSLVRRRLAVLKQRRSREVASETIEPAREAAIPLRPLAILLEELTSLDPEVQVAALTGLERRTEAGDLEARRRLGFLYLEDDVIARDVAIAVEYLEPAAARGDVDAHRALGLLKWKGAGVERDYRAARRHLEVAGLAGDGVACHRLAGLLRGVGEDPEIVTDWLRRGAEAGNQGARYELALDILARPGAREDEVLSSEARELLELAARGGSVEAQYSLAVCLGQGVGGPVDGTAARAWMARAAASGHDLARMVAGEDQVVD